MKASLLACWLVFALAACGPPAPRELRGKYFRLDNSTKSEIWHFHANGAFTRLIAVQGFGFGSQITQSGRYWIQGNTIKFDFQSQQSAAVSGSSLGSVAAAGRSRHDRVVYWSFQWLGKNSFRLNGHRPDPYTMPD